MNTTSVDKLNMIAAGLAEAGFDKVQADETAKVILSAVEQRDDTLATKSDIAELKTLIYRTQLSTIGILGALITLFQFLN